MEGCTGLAEMSMLFLELVASATALFSIAHLVDSVGNTIEMDFPGMDCLLESQRLLQTIGEADNNGFDMVADQLMLRRKAPSSANHVQLYLLRPAWLMREVKKAM